MKYTILSISKENIPIECSSAFIWVTIEVLGLKIHHKKIQWHHCSHLQSRDKWHQPSNSIFHLSDRSCKRNHCNLHRFRSHNHNLDCNFQVRRRNYVELKLSANLLTCPIVNFRLLIASSGNFRTLLWIIDSIGIRPFVVVVGYANIIVSWTFLQGSQISWSATLWNTNPWIDISTADITLKGMS